MTAASGFIHFLNSVMVAAETDREKRRQCGYIPRFIPRRSPTLSSWLHTVYRTYGGSGGVRLRVQWFQK